ncbi:MAG: RNA polymerase sigma factor [Candidatus Aminicenantales bacterium]|jgi:RNA polymerase sigma-70 factor (ECF subfamily)
MKMYTTHERAASPDRELFEELLTNSALVFHICLGYSINLSDAEELYQDVYLKAWQDIGSVRVQNSARPWLLRIARNVCLNHLRKKRQDRRLFYDNQLPMVERDTPEMSIIRGELGLVLKGAVQSLPTRFRDVFVMREYGQLSYEEISETLGIKIGTVMSRLSRARRSVMEELKENGYGRENGK